MARGTAAAPTAAQLNDVLGSFESWGYGATAFGAAARGYEQVWAAENFTDTAQGTTWHVGTTKKTTIVTTDGLVMDDTQHLTIGNTTVPTIAGGACGTGSNGTIVAGSNDHAFTINIGAVATTACTVTFGNAYATAPRVCTFSPANAAAAAATTLAYSAAPSVSAWVLNGAVLASTNWVVHCY